MKKTRLITIVFAFTLLCGVLLLTACGGNNGSTDGTGTNKDPIKLEAPLVTLDGDVASWGADSNADKFEISINGNLSYIENSVTSKKLSDGETFKIRAIGDGINYTTSGWSDVVTYNEPENPHAKKYTVIWKSSDIVLETDIDVAEGSMPVYNGAIPTKQSDAQYTYTFSGWSPQVVAVSGNATYEAVFTSVLNTYKVVWKNGDTVLEIDENVPYGTTPVYNGAEPKKAADAQYSYVFSGWTPKVVAASENVIYNAVFTSVLNKYTVIWKNGDTVLEIDENVPYGTMPEYNGALPTKDAEGENNYEFVGWTPDVTAVSGDVVYYARFVNPAEQFTVTFVDFDNSIIDIQEVSYGSDAVSPDEPIRTNYKFIGWDKEFINITNNLIVKARYTRQYTVSFIDFDGTPLSTEVVLSGEAATSPTEPSREGYTFVGWDKDYGNVTSDMVVQAKYEINRYTVTFLHADGSIISTVNNVAHGKTVTPPKTVDMYFDWSKTKGYRFTGWKDWDESQPIVKNISITAEYSEEIGDLIIAIETKEISKGTTTAEVSVYLCGSFENIYGISLKLHYAEQLVLSNGSVIINSKLVGSESTLNTENSLYELSWADGQGIDVSERLEILTLTFSVDKYTNVSEYIIELLKGTYIIDENLSKITPIMIVGHVIITE